MPKKTDTPFRALTLAVTTAVVASGAAMAYTAGDVSTTLGTTNLRSPATGTTTSPSIYTQTGATCTSTATDAGYLQRQISDGTQTYIQSVVADTSQTNPSNANTSNAYTFSDLAFVDTTTVIQNTCSVSTATTNSSINQAPNVTLCIDQSGYKYTHDYQR